MKYSILLLVRASQPDETTMPAHHCSCVCPAEDWLLDAHDLVDDSYVLPESQFLPLPRQEYNYEESFLKTDMLACSYPSPQHNPGESSKIVIVVVLELVLCRPFLRTMPGQEGWCAMTCRRRRGCS